MIETKGRVETRDELHEQFARCIRMCEGANIDPYRCVKYPGMTIGKKHGFTYKPSMYIFAISLINNKPCFVGDVLYRVSGESVVVEEGSWLDMLSWAKPNKLAI